MTMTPVCLQCEVGELHHDVRDVQSSHHQMKATVNLISGLFCNHCDEIIFDANTDSAKRYAQVSDVMVIADR